MDAKRAKEILDSPRNIEVLHNGELVWLQKTSNDSGKIDVINLKNRERMSVALSDLEESGRSESSITH